MTIGATLEWAMLLTAILDLGLNIWMLRRLKRRRDALSVVDHSRSARRTGRLMANEARWRIAFAVILIGGAVRWLRIPDVNSGPADQLKGAFALLAVALLVKTIQNIRESRAISDDYAHEIGINFDARERAR